MPTTSSQHKLTHIKHLRQFYQPQNQLFEDAYQLPQFFLTNLIDDMRVVKYFHNDPQANIKIFYYQYLKLCFEIDNVDYQSYIEKIYQLIRTQGFQFFFQPNDPQKEMKNAQFKSLLIDFFQLMNTSSMTIDNVLKEYPIMNDVFTNFFRTVVMIATITSSYDAYIDKNELFDFLSSFFSVDISSYDKCLKFVESDIFVYEEDQQNIYMAYIAEDIEEEGEDGSSHNRRGSKLLEHEMKTVKEDQYESQVSANTQQVQQPQLAVRLLVQHSASNSHLVPQNDQNIQANPNALKPRAKTIIKQSYIESQFADYTSFSNNISNLGKNVSVQQQKQVFIETLQPNTTVNETESQDVNNREEIIEQNAGYDIGACQQQQQQQREMLRVKSAQNNLMLSVNHAESLQIQVNQPLYSKLQQSQPKSQLSKSTSQPNFYYRQKSLHQLAESCFQSLDSNLQPMNVQQQMNNQELKQEQSQKFLQQQSQKSGSKILIQGGEKLMKKGLVSLGLEQQSHMYVSYQEPTKDPGFMEKDLTARFVQQAILQQQSTNRSLYHNLAQYNMSKPVQTNNDINTQQSIKLKQPLIYNPTIKPSYQLQTQKQQQSTKKLSFPNSRLVQSSNSQSQHFYNPSLKSINNNIKTNILSTPSQQRLKLNVTKQFTNSFVMKSMSQPYKTEVYRTRERARQFRKNIYQQFISQTTGNSNSYNLYPIQQNSYSSKIDQFSQSYHQKKPSSRTSTPSQSSLKPISVKNIQLQPFLSISKTSLSQQKQQPIYPVSMVKQQQKVYSNQISLVNSKIETNKNDLSKISQTKEISQVISAQSRKSIQSNINNSNIRSNQRQIVPSISVQGQQIQSKVTASIYNAGLENNSFKKIPTYQPVLLKGPKSIIQQQQQPTYQPQQYQPNNYTVHTVMPHSHHYHHTPQNNNQQYKINYNIPPTIDSVGTKPYQQQQGLMSVIPQTQKPHPLYIPFERRK